MRSILFTKQMRGTRYLSAWRQTVSDCGSTPATESNSAIEPSSTRSERSTSTVKSTWPGVSTMLLVFSSVYLRGMMRFVVGACEGVKNGPCRPATSNEDAPGDDGYVRVVS